MKKRICALLTLVASVLLLATPVLAAVANPDSITLHTVKVFENIFETDDVLFVVSYEVEYKGTGEGGTDEPSEPAEDTFLIAVYDEDGTTLIQSRPLNDYQYNVHSVYFTKTQADASVDWGDEYVVRVMGNSAFFPMTEDTTMDTMTLSTWSWVEGTMAESRDLLRLHCLDLAATLEDEWAIPLIITTPEKQVLNSAGRAAFLNAIPSLDAAVPSLFQVATSAIAVTQQTRTAAYEGELTVESQLGTTLKGAFDGIGIYLGVTGGTVAMMWALLFVLVVTSIIFLNSGNTTAALVLAIPIVILCTAVGAIPMAALFTMGAILTLYTAYHVWLRGM